MLNAGELTGRLIAAGIATPGELIGCSDAELSDIAKTTGKTLPTSYRRLMHALGKSAGGFMRDIEFLYPAVLKLNDEAEEMLKHFEAGAITLPPHAFVWATRYGEQFMWFNANGHSEDPEIYFYVERQGHFKRIADSLWQVIEAELRMARA